MYTCEYCQRKIKNKGGLAAHSPYCVENPSRIKRKKSPNAHAKKGTSSWSKGLNKHNDERFRKMSERQKGKKFGASLHGHTEETKQKLSLMKKNKKYKIKVRNNGQIKFSF
jgi:hypothetical protein